MIPGLIPRANELQRTFQVRSGANTGTGFLIDVEQRQYLVSALHVVEQAAEAANLEIFANNQWQPTPVVVVGIDMINDVAVFALPERRVGAEFPIQIDGAGAVLGQGAFFLGYPLGLRGIILNPGFPMPLVTRGNICSFHQGPPNQLYLSCDAPPGFSGAPVYYARNGVPVLTGVVIEELAYQVPVKDAEENQVGLVWTPSGIVTCSYINCALDLIAANPVGLALN